MDMPTSVPPGTGPPDNNLAVAVIALFFCWPFAIPALINATQVQSRWAMGDQAGAILAANEAKRWGKIGIIVGAVLTAIFIVCWIAYFVIIIGMIGAAATISTSP